LKTDQLLRQPVVGHRRGVGPLGEGVGVEQAIERLELERRQPAIGQPLGRLALARGDEHLAAHVDLEVLAHAGEAALTMQGEGQPVACALVPRLDDARADARELRDHLLLRRHRAQRPGPREDYRPGHRLGLERRIGLQEVGQVPPHPIALQRRGDQRRATEPRGSTVQRVDALAALAAEFVPP